MGSGAREWVGSGKCAIVFGTGIGKSVSIHFQCDGFVCEIVGADFNRNGFIDISLGWEKNFNGGLGRCRNRGGRLEKIVNPPSHKNEGNEGIHVVDGAHWGNTTTLLLIVSNPGFDTT